MDKNKNSHHSSQNDSMSKAKTYQDYNKQKPNPNDPNQDHKNPSSKPNDKKNETKLSTSNKNLLTENRVHKSDSVRDDKRIRRQETNKGKI